MSLTPSSIKQALPASPAVMLTIIPLVLMLIWGIGLVLCQPACAAPIIPVAGLIYWHWKFKGTLALHKWLWVYVIAQVAIFLSLPAPQDATWEPLGAKSPRFFSEYGRIRIENIRDFRHRSAEAYESAYREESFRIKDFSSASYAEACAPDGSSCRPMILFELRDGRSLVLSTEVRYQEGKHNSLNEWYKGCGLLYLFGTEEDLFLRSTEMLHEQLRVYRMEITPEQAQRLFRSCVALSRRAISGNEVYNPLWEHYASGIGQVLKGISPSMQSSLPCSTGALAKKLYDAGCLQKQAGESFAALQRRCTVSNTAVQREAYADAWRRSIGAPLKRPAPIVDDEDEGDDGEEEEEDLRPVSTGLQFSGNRFTEDIPEPGDRGGIPYTRSAAAGRAASIPEPGARLRAENNPTTKKKKKKYRSPR